MCANVKGSLAAERERDFANARDCLAVPRDFANARDCLAVPREFVNAWYQESLLTPGTV